MLTTRELAIVYALRHYGDQSITSLIEHVYYSDDNLAVGERPAATTTRRTIGDLRRKGVNIVATLPGSRNSRYTLVSTPNGAGDAQATV